MRYTSTINGTLTRAAFVARNQRCGSLITGSPGEEDGSRHFFLEHEDRHGGPSADPPGLRERDPLLGHAIVIRSVADDHVIVDRNVEDPAGLYELLGDS